MQMKKLSTLACAAAFATLSGAASAQISDNTEPLAKGALRGGFFAAGGKGGGCGRPFLA